MGIEAGTLLAYAAVASVAYTGVSAIVQHNDDPQPLDYGSGLREDKAKSRRARSALYKTEGGAMGQELQPGEVGGRDTFFGN